LFVQAGVAGVDRAGGLDVPAELVGSLFLAIKTARRLADRLDVDLEAVAHPGPPSATRRITVIDSS